MATTSQVVTSQLPSAFETFYTSGAEGQKGLIPQAFQLFGQGTPQAYQATYMDPLKAAGMYTGAQRVAPLSGAQQARHSAARGRRDQGLYPDPHLPHQPLLAQQA